MQQEQTSDLRQIRIDKLKALQEQGKDPFKIERYNRTHFSNEVLEKYDELEGKNVLVAGRVLSKRMMGKASFIHIQDANGQIQAYVKQDEIGEEAFADFKTIDIGDILGIEGTVFKTKTGETSIHALKVTLLTKSLFTLPEKYHGLKDPELRYRQRYVDLIVNPEVREIFLKRNIILRGVRSYLDERNFLEVETPILQTVAGGAAARPFFTHHNTLDLDMQMRIANELFLKRLIVGGFDRVYEMGKMFRNEGIDYKHNPEYTMIELYASYMDYEYMMELLEGLVEELVLKLYGTTVIDFQGTTLDFKRPWKRISMNEAVLEKTGVDFLNMELEAAREKAKEMKLDILPFMTQGHFVNLAFEEFIEEDLVQPTFVMHHPVEISPLAKRNPEDPRITNRFEAFVNKWEIANAFSELNDPVDQRQRFEDQVKAKEGGDEESHPMDEDFLQAIEVGLPPTGGMGIGIDRLVMLLTNQASIRETIFFPTMKPQGQEKKKETKKEVKIDFSKVKIEPLFEEMVDFDTFSKSDFRAVKVKTCEAVKKSKKLLKFTLDDGTDKERIILSGIREFYEPEELVGKTLLAITNLPPRAMMGEESCGMLLSAIHDEEGEEKLQLIMLADSIPPGAKLY
ncbi:lysine--tRNA ligase [Guggenheimella bovis]